MRVWFVMAVVALVALAVLGAVALGAFSDATSQQLPPSPRPHGQQRDGLFFEVGIEEHKKGVSVTVCWQAEVPYDLSEATTAAASDASEPESALVEVQPQRLPKGLWISDNLDAARYERTRLKRAAVQCKMVDKLAHALRELRQRRTELPPAARFVNRAPLWDRFAEVHGLERTNVPFGLIAVMGGVRVQALAIGDDDEFHLEVSALFSPVLDVEYTVLPKGPWRHSGKRSAAAQGERAKELFFKAFELVNDDKPRRQYPPVELIEELVHIYSRLGSVQFCWRGITVRRLVPRHPSDDIVEALRTLAESVKRITSLFGDRGSGGPYRVADWRSHGTD